MTHKLNKTVKYVVAATLVGSMMGCATTSNVENAQSTAEQALQKAEQALQAAQEAKQAADQAQQTAERANSAASQANQKADQALLGVQDMNEKIDRMFKQTMQK